MDTYKVDIKHKWDYENGFYLTSDHTRIGKWMNHLKIYEQITHLPGDILEFGVYKGASFMRLLAFRDLMECEDSRKVIGFDAFGKFPNDVQLKSDKEFITSFEGNGGLGISKEDLTELIRLKNISNFELIKGNILDTLPLYLEQNPHTKVALLHIDVDVYEPTKRILELLWDRLVTSGILMLDDYATVEGETRAVDEFFRDKKVTINKPPFYKVPSYIIKN